MNVDDNLAGSATIERASSTTQVSATTSRRSRPGVEGLESRQVLSTVTASQVIAADQAIAAYFAKPLLSAYVQIAVHHGTATAGNVIGQLTSISNLNNFLKRDGLSAIANFKGGTAQLQYDMLYDVLYLAAHAGGRTTPTTVVNPTTAASSTYSSEVGLSTLTTRNQLANDNWGGDSSLAAAGLGVVGD